MSWRVPTIELDPAGALAWLATVADGGAGGIRCGASLRYLAGLAAFAGELVERGRVLPTVVRDETGPLARWRPALQGPDVVAFGALVTAMPPVCRAELGRDDAHDLVTDALHVLTDAASRDRLGPGVDLVPPRRGRRPKRVPAIEAWLAALTAADGRFDADDDEVSALERELRPWAEIGTGRVGPARATFRLSEVEPQLESRRVRRLAAGVPAAVHPTRACSCRPPRCGRMTAACAAGWTGRRSCCSPSWAGPAGSIPSWPRPCGRPPRRAGPGRRRRPPVPGRGAPVLDEAGFGVLLPSWWDRRARLGLKASASTPTDGVVAGGHSAGRRWSTSSGSWPSATRR